MNLKQVYGKMFENKWNTSTSQVRKDAMVELITRVENGTLDGVGMTKCYMVVTSPTQTNTYESYQNAILFTTIEEAGGNTYELFLPRDPMEYDYDFRLNIDSVNNQATLLPTSLRRYTSGSAYTTHTKEDFLSLFGDWVMFDFVNVGASLGTQQYGFILPYYNDTKQNPSHSIGIRMLYNGETVILPFCLNNQGSLSSTYFKEDNFVVTRYMENLSAAGTTPYVNDNCIPLLEIYAAMRQGVSDIETVTNRYTLRGTEIYRITNSSGNTPFFIMKKELVDDFIKDFYNTFNIELIYTGNIVNPITGDPIPTAPGQEPNTVDNQGGTGEFSSDAIETQQTGATGTTSYSGTTYAINKSAFNAVKNELWDNDFITLIRNLAGSGQGTIINCLLFPFNISGITSNLISVNSLYLGTHELPLTSPQSAYAIPSGGVAEVTIGPLTGFKKVMGGFLDDNGVTECYIHLPFIGLKQIDPEIVYGHTFKVKYLFDYMNGECQALLISNMATDSTGKNFTNQEVICYEFSGQAGIPIGFSESNVNSLIMNVGIKALKGTFQGGWQGGGEALVEGAMGVIGGPNAQMEGATGSSIERLKSLDTYLLFIRPKTTIPENYNKTKGRPSMLDKPLSECKGFTQIDDPIIYTTATEPEKEQIISLLKQGVRIL